MIEKNKYTLGLVSVSFRDRSPKEILAAMKSEGLSVIEWGSDIHAPYHESEKLCEISELQKEYGIICSSYGTYFRLGQTPMEELAHYINAAKVLGTKILRLWCGIKSGADMSEEERSSFLALCRDAAKIAEKSGVILCMECHKKTFTERLEDALWLIKQVDSPAFRMYWQPFQWKNIEDNLEYAESIASYVEYLHVFQWKEKERFPLAEGIEEWKEYLKKFPTPRTLLLEFMPDDRLESLPLEVKSLKKIIEEKE